MCLRKLKFLGKLNRIVIELSQKFKIHRTRLDFTPSFSATRAFFKSGTQVPAETSKYGTMVLQRFNLRCKLW
jgi:hypothetical protein